LRDKKRGKVPMKGCKVLIIVTQKDEIGYVKYAEIMNLRDAEYKYIGLD
jgi:hypothetical protein